MKRLKSVFFIGALLAANLMFVSSETSGSDVATVDFEPWGECAWECSEVPGWCNSFCYPMAYEVCDNGGCPPPAPCPECV